MNKGVQATETINKGLRRRYRAEQRFKRLGIAAISSALFFLAFLFVSIFSKGYPAFQQTYMQLDVVFSEDVFTGENLATANYPKLVKQSMSSMFPEATSRKDKRDLYQMVSSGASFTLQDMVTADPTLIGTEQSIWVLADDDIDMFMKGKIDPSKPQSERRLNDKQLEWINSLIAAGKVEKRFNTVLFTAGDSREPELAGILGAAQGSLLTLMITLALSFPIGVAAAVYLEEFAPANKWTDMIEININNQRGEDNGSNEIQLSFYATLSSLVLTLMTLPTIIIAGRASLKSVPPSVREAALGVGASKLQTITHHVLPLALPGMLTGTIIGMAQALGETAPLLMIGMVAFIVDVPSSITDPATALPVQIFLWSDSPERAFTERTSAAIMILLTFLIFMNATAVVLRKKFEIKW